MGWNYHWSLGIDEWFHTTLYDECDYSFMLGLKLNHVWVKGAHGVSIVIIFYKIHSVIWKFTLFSPKLNTHFRELSGTDVFAVTKQCLPIITHGLQPSFIRTSYKDTRIMLFWDWKANVKFKHLQGITLQKLFFKCWKFMQLFYSHFIQLRCVMI